MFDACFRASLPLTLISEFPPPIAHVMILFKAAPWFPAALGLKFKLFPGEENGNPLQYSCLENPMDRGAWQAMQSMESQELDTT